MTTLHDSAAAIEEARQLDGIFAGMCQPDEYEWLIEAGLLRLSYEGASGFLGLAKLRAATSGETP